MSLTQKLSMDLDDAEDFADGDEDEKAAARQKVKALKKTLK